MPVSFSRTTFATGDPGVAEHWLAEVYGSVSLDRGFGAFSQRLASDDGLLVASSHWDGVIGSTVEMDRLVIVSATAPSAWRSPDGEGDLAAAPALFRAGVPYVAHSDRGTQLAAFDPAGLERTGRLLYADDDLAVEFDGADPATPRAGRFWLATVAVIQAYIDAGLLDDPLVRAPALRLLKVAALRSFRLAGDPRERHLSAERRRRVFEAAREFVHEFASLPITLDDIAEAGGASVPELVNAFRAHTPDEARPGAYLRRVRLDAAHRDLVAGDPTAGDTVREIALRWGFSPKSFAASYRTWYGHNPRWTLDR
jgi:AraC-like DNA-binding protein